MTDTTNGGVVQLVRFRSRLSAGEIERRYRDRMPQFRELPGLVQKYYVHDPETGEWGGIYVWDSRESLDAFQKTELRASIPAAYEIEGAPRVEILALRDALRS